MTYMPESHLSETTSPGKTEAEASSREKLKILAQEGSDRSKRIFQILRSAFLETREEFQAGRTVISPLAQEVTTEVVSTVKEKSQQAAKAVNKAWKDESDAPDVAERALAFLKTLSKTTKVHLFPTLEKQVKQQLSQLDNVLERRYGDQYATLKGRFESVRNWVMVDETAQTDAVMQDISDTEPSVVIEIESEVVK